MGPGEPATQETNDLDNLASDDPSAAGAQCATACHALSTAWMQAHLEQP